MENLASGIKAGAITAMLCFGLLMLSANEVYATGNNNNRPCDRVTGGGYIYTAAGGNGTFAVNFGRNAKNELFVQINFIDHATGLRVKAGASLILQALSIERCKLRHQSMILQRLSQSKGLRQRFLQQQMRVGCLIC